MKLIFVILFLLTFTCVQAQDNTVINAKYGNKLLTQNTIRYDVYIMAGQSNMVGSINYASLIPPYFNPNWYSFIYRYGLTEPAKSDYTNATAYPTLGIEWCLGFNYTQYKKRYIAIKYAYSGTRLAQDVGLDWNVNSTGEYFDSLITLVNNFKTYSNHRYIYNIKGVVWFQGEADATLTYSPLYYQNQLDLIDSLRSKLSIVDLPIYIYHIHQQNAYRDVINNAKDSAQVHRANVFSIPVEDMPFKADSTHMTSEGYKQASDTLWRYILRLNY